MPMISSPGGIDPFSESSHPINRKRIQVSSKMVQPSPDHIPIKIDGEEVNVSDIPTYRSIKPKIDFNMIDDTASPTLNVRSPGRTTTHADTPIKIDLPLIRIPSPKRTSETSRQIHSTDPIDPPEDYIEGPHKIIGRMPKDPRSNVVYVGRRQEETHMGHVPHPSVVSPLSKLPDGVDESAVTIEQLQGYANGKRLLLYKRIPVKFNEASMIDWSKFSNEFKGRMYKMILQRLTSLVQSNRDILGDSRLYIRKFESIEDLYSQYMLVKNIVDTEWMRKAIHTGLVLLYMGIGAYLDNVHDMNTAPIISLIIQHGISNELIRHLDITPKVTNQVIRSGGIPVLWKFLGVIVINVLLVYLVCTYIDNESSRKQIAQVSRVVNDVAEGQKIGMAHMIQAGLPLASMIGDKMGVDLGSIMGMMGGGGTSKTDDYGVEEEE